MSPAYGGFAAQERGASGDVVPDSYIVVLQDGASADDVAAAHGVAKSHVYNAVFNGFAGKVPPGRVNALRNDPNVVSVTANPRVYANPKPDKPGGGGKDKNKPPAVSIDSPADNSSFDSGTPVTFTGTAIDDTDGDVSASIEWSSDIIPDSLGTGALIVSANLADGTHTITASATDLDGKTGSASITITMGTPSNQTVPSGVARIGAAPSDLLSHTGAGVGVAILDSGIDYTHPDLAGNYVGGYDFINNDNDPMDDNGHGTHVAGIVAAVDNDSGVVGVAPNAKLYAVKVLNSAGSGSDAVVIAGLDWVVDNWDLVDPNIRAVNISLGRDAFSPSVDLLMHNAIIAVVDAGIIVVVSAGNDRFQEISENVPAGFPEVMAIASSTAQDGTGPSKGRCSGMQVLADTASLFTTDGAGVAISAPGNSHEDISKGCSMQSIGILSLQLGGGTTRKSGTSMSAPHVTGVVALLWDKADESAVGTLSPADARTAITGSAYNTNPATLPLNSPVSGYSFDGVREGILNAAVALALP